ncbi:pyruvate kinase [Candidatus Shapirobacteria bacterium]|nr:pyruvate kinase [Candidatus Shapirobacteria bacterium]
MLKRTKIIATIGPASESADVIQRLILAGANIFRFNLKHNDLAWHESKVKLVRQVSDSLSQNCPVILDLQGPELRIDTKDGATIEVAEGDRVKISQKFLKFPKSIRLIQKQVITDLSKGDSLFIDDGNLELKVVSKKAGVVTAKTLQSGVIKNRKSINFPSINVDLPLLTDHDIEALDVAAKINADFVALSFVRTAKDIDKLRSELVKRKCFAKIIAKIENATALKNLPQIIATTDAVMVARGDLGIEVPLKELALWQKKMIDLCRQHNKPVIVATQMLMSMIDRGRPTRAEATDVANAVFDGADCLMLSDETAVGHNPPRVVHTMSDIAQFAENSGELRHTGMIINNLSDVLIDSAVKVVTESTRWPISAAIVFTQSGYTAKVFSTYRLNVPIIAISDNRDNLKLLNLSYGIIPFYAKLTDGQFKLDGPVFQRLIEAGLIKEDSQAIVVHGQNWLSSGSTRSISIKQF